MYSSSVTVLMMRFNPRARRGRDVGALSAVSANTGFNPRARRGRDYTEAGVSQARMVSIHAPAGGATMCRMELSKS